MIKMLLAGMILASSLQAVLQLNCEGGNRKVNLYMLGSEGDDTGGDIVGDGKAYKHLWSKGFRIHYGSKEGYLIMNTKGYKGYKGPKLKVTEYATGKDVYYKCDSEWLKFD